MQMMEQGIEACPDSRKIARVKFISPRPPRQFPAWQYRTIEAGMTKSSKFEHDAAVLVSRIPIPHPDELGEDIEKLEAWRLLIVGRRNDIRAARA
ncbi:hypothetical protein WT27_22250 [Burkholderia territorii]|uniref:Uncharacterized protein n=3 Tax=Burkholderia TaxID=32008 RepID=A0A105W2L9_9BURK|nr:hypothetical protein WT27_22250 [Burkholderia territorii]